MATPTSVDAYIAGYPPKVQVVLRKIRRIIRSVASEAEESISYRIPCFKQNGVLIYYAAFKNQIVLYPPVSGDARLEKAAAPYAGEKGNLRFALDKPIPYHLIERVTRLRLKQNHAKPAR